MKLSYLSLVTVILTGLCTSGCINPKPMRRFYEGPRRNREDLAFLTGYEVVEDSGRGVWTLHPDLSFFAKRHVYGDVELMQPPLVSIVDSNRTLRGMFTIEVTPGT